MEGTVKCAANYVPLTPISFLERSAVVYRERVSVVYGSVRFTWGETRERCVRLASALSVLGVSRGDVVAALAPNIPAMYELHFGVPMAGAVLCALNIRLDSAMVSVLLRHSEAKVIFVDYQFIGIAKGAFDILSAKGFKLPTLILIAECDPKQLSITSSTFSSSAIGSLEYESFLETGKLDFQIVRPKDEWDPIALNYTSGTTSSPKGVVYSHRGAYLNSLSTVLLNGMGLTPVYLWTLPMFHCNGWCFTWGVAAQGGTSICLRAVSAKTVFDNIVEHHMTHMCGAPTVLNTLINASVEERKPLPETFGPGTVCTWKPEWNSLPREEQAKIKSRQGVHHSGMEEVDVKDPITMKSVPADAKTIGEVMFRGNPVMSGYLKNLKATKEAFEGGWFRTGDLAVKHADNYMELKDRSKDIIISGGRKH
uniref:AMP-dependent synthetase/ligase domain-containing protein n=1 Tax=Kalanchoe fedtschenkoi TaxID=63787 RepID=A0A7N0UUI0_KALFE